MTPPPCLFTYYFIGSVVGGAIFTPLLLMYVCYVCMYGMYGMYVMYVRMYVCMCVYVCVCMCVFMYICKISPDMFSIQGVNMFWIHIIQINSSNSTKYESNHTVM